MPLHRPSLLAGLRSQAAIGRTSLYLSPLGQGVQDPLLGSLRQDRPAYVKAIERFAQEHNIPVVHFKKGENKDETAGSYLEAAAPEGQGRVVLIGIAQEKASAWRSWKGKGQETAAHPHMEWGRQMAHINRLVEQVSALLDAPYTSRQASYDLRWLRRKGLIDKVPRKRQYHLTPLGRTSLLKSNYSLLDTS